MYKYHKFKYIRLYFFSLINIPQYLFGKKNYIIRFDGTFVSTDDISMKNFIINYKKLYNIFGYKVPMPL